ncbi:hypothetical protein [Halarcobacter sp.]|uniref:hypothetical protein n=1 Tax=Halarcobacter sp. TaxID=2321133 RepID=UPI0029F4C6D7|nr:hypothetical protein [Halarcobacter sp.]
MNKVKIDDSSKNEIYKYIKTKFNGGFKKNSKDDTWDIKLEDFNELIKKYLFQYDGDINLEKLVKYSSKEMDNLINSIKKDKIEFNDKKDLEKVSFSKYFHELYIRLDNFLIIEALNIKVCLYCNRNYIVNFKNNNGKQVTAQLDHFHNKDEFPFFSVTIENLIPSCPTCNIRKSNLNKEIFNPYSDCFHNHANFKYNGIVDSDEKYDFFHEKRVKLELEYFGDEHEKIKAENYNSVFNIKSIYNEHRNIVSDLLKKEIIYSDEYVEKLYENYKGIFKSKKEVFDMVLNTDINEDEMNNSPMNKLICDISKQLGILKKR